jgi:hypothetical protein
MEIQAKIQEYEQEIKRLQLKIELLKECQGEPQKPIAELFNAVPAQVAPKPKEVIEKAPEQVISRTQKGKVVTEEVWIGGEGAGKAKDYYGK